MRRTLGLILFTLIVVAPQDAAAQDGFLFKPPVLTLSVRAGASMPSANDGVFDLFTRELTLDRGDFSSASVGADLAVRVAPNVDVVLGVAHSYISRSSEFRDWVDQDDQPIEQTTELSRTPLTLSAKIYPFGRGRLLGKHAWVPTAMTPYVGAGGGLMFYKLEQEGDFVDYQTLDVYHDFMRSSGSGAMAQVFAGAEWWPAKRVGLTAEGRYAWSKPTLHEGFRDFGEIDLSGFQLVAGIATRF